MNETLPIFPLNTVMFPGMLLPLHIFEERYREMVRDCMAGDLRFGVAFIRSGSEVGAPALPYSVGTAARIVRVDPEEDGRFHLIALGEERFLIRELLTDRSYLQAFVEPLEDTDREDPELSTLAREAGREFKRYLALLASLTDRWIGDIELPPDPETLSHTISARLHILPRTKQPLLETTSIRQRLHQTTMLMRQEVVQLEEVLSNSLRQDGEGPPS